MPPWLLLCAVLAYQGLGTLGGWTLGGDVHLVMQDFRAGIPGMVLQVAGGYAFIKYLLYK